MNLISALYRYGRLKRYTAELITNVTNCFVTVWVFNLLKICQMILKMCSSVFFNVIAIGLFNLLQPGPEFTQDFFQCIVLSCHTSILPSLAVDLQLKSCQLQIKVPITGRENFTLNALLCHINTTLGQNCGLKVNFQMLLNFIGKTL